MVVDDVDGPAAEAGLRPGDVILGVNGTRVKSIAELRNAAQGRQARRAAGAELRSVQGVSQQRIVTVQIE